MPDPPVKRKGIDPAGYRTYRPPTSATSNKRRKLPSTEEKPTEEEEAKRTEESLKFAAARLKSFHEKGTKSNPSKTTSKMQQSKLDFGNGNPKCAAESSTSKSTAEASNPDTANSPPMTETFPPLTPNGLALTEIIGDIFAAPPNTLLIHACNCLGSWSAGIAAAFKKNYPAAFLVYEKHCRDSIPEDLIGTALMIPPWEKDDSKPKHYVGCLFTSKKYGKGRDSPEEILRSTKPAMEQLIKLVGEDGGVDGVRMCRINSGLFSVRWEDSREVLRGIEVEEGVKCPTEVEVFELADPPVKKTWNRRPTGRKGRK